VVVGGFKFFKRAQRHQAKDSALPGRTVDLLCRKVNIELVVVAVSVPVGLGESKRSYVVGGAVVRDARAELRHTQQIMRFDGKKNALPDAFLGEQASIYAHGCLLTWLISTSNKAAWIRSAPVRRATAVAAVPRNRSIGFSTPVIAKAAKRICYEQLVFPAN
jgi:hypothetical protein